MRTPAIVLIVLLVVIAAAMHFLFFGPYSAKWNMYHQNLLDSREQFLKLTVRAEDPAKVAALSRQVIADNNRYREQLYEIARQYEVVRPPVPEGDVEAAVLERLRALEAQETSPAALEPVEPADGGTRVRVLQSWSIAANLRDGKEGNRFFRATDDAIRVYAAGPSRISPASGTVDLYIRPVDWEKKEDRTAATQRVIFRAQGHEPEKPGMGERASFIQLSVVPNDRLEFTVSGPGAPPVIKTADIRTWQPGTDFYRITFTWGPAQNQTDLFINGKRAAQYEPRGRTGSPGALPYSSFMERYNPYGAYGYPGAYGMPAPRTGRSTTALAAEVVPVPESLEKIFLGRTDTMAESAGVDIDNLMILRGAAADSVIDAGIQYSDDTLMFDTFQTTYGDPRLLESSLRAMAGCTKLINEPLTKEDLKEQKREEYNLLRKSIGLPDDALKAESPATQYLVKVLMADQIHRLVKGKGLTLDEIQSILGVPRAAKGNEDQRQSIATILGFTDLVLAVVNQAKEDRLVELTDVKILGESATTSDADLLEQFKTLVDQLREKLGIKEVQAFPGMPGMGASPYGMPGGMPGGPPGMGAFYMQLMQQRYGGGMPGFMGGGVPEGYGTYQEYQAELNDYNRYKEQLAKGVVPADVRPKLAKMTQGSIYTRRILELQVLGKIDYLPQFLYDVEYKKRLATIQWISLERAGEDLLNCGLGVDFHYVSQDEIKPATAPAAVEG